MNVKRPGWDCRASLSLGAGAVVDRRLFWQSPMRRGDQRAVARAA